MKPSCIHVPLYRKIMRIKQVKDEMCEKADAAALFLLQYVET
jgi:hypothetical protein